MTSIPSLWRRLNDPRFDAPPPLLNSSYIPSLDGWRAFSIFVVILSHCTVHENWNMVLFNGQLGVNIFFVISGFLITTLLLKEKSGTGSISLSRFYTRRFLRIFPVACLYLAILLVLNALFLLHIPTISFTMGFLYLKNLDFIHTSDWQSGHFWSLAVEEQFYLVFPFILRYNYKLYVKLLCLLILFVPLINIAVLYRPGNILFRVLLDILGRGTASILCGSLCAILVFKRIITPEWMEKYKRLGWVVCLFAVIIGSRSLVAFPGKETLALYLFAPAACVMLLFSMQPGTFLYSFLNRSIVRRIGVLSYSLYVWQQLFTNEQPWEHAFAYGGALWWNLPLMLLVAWMSYRFYEKPFLKLKDRFKAGARKPAPPPTAVQSMAL